MPTQTGSRNSARARGSWALLPLVSALALGCASGVTHRLFFGRQLQPGPSASNQPPAIIVQGASELGVNGRYLSLTFANHGMSEVRFSYIQDQYVARTVDGRAVILEKDFGSYPNSLGPGKEASVTLRPGTLAIGHIAQIIATINGGRTVVVVSAAHSGEAANNTTPRPNATPGRAG